jgi:hypothetical protein
MIWKILDSGRGIIKVRSRHLPGWSEENHESVISRPGVELNTNRMQVYSITATPAYWDVGTDVNTFA